ncbi:uncharacterized protein LOC142325420 isoform X2 [Lycorma delicatula]|uniref:uncharacterized protein LOC142325420 isoform X2 n=1 Tax=Lycorma delicatula TaxID=130591 RepID=UPI003F51372A
MPEQTEDEGAGDSANHRTLPNCVRCRNHGEKMPLRGHKRYCQFRDCRCNKCLMTKERQQMMARQIAQRRKNAQDADRLKKGLPVPASPTTEIDDPDTPSSNSSGFNSGHSTTTNYPTSSSSNSNLSAVSSSTITSSINNSTTPTVMNISNNNNNSNNNSNSSSNNNNYNISGISSNNSNNNNIMSTATINTTTEPVRLESIWTLLEMLHLNMDFDTYTLLYIILKQVNSDVKEAYRKIVEAQEEMRPLKAQLLPECPPPLPYKPLPVSLSFLPPQFPMGYRIQPYFKTSSSIPPTYPYPENLQKEII